MVYLAKYVKSALPKSNSVGLLKELRIRQISTYEGKKKVENKETEF